MTTTPTLYVGDPDFVWDGMHKARYIEDARPATHDELIAAMPRCGTCGEWVDLKDASGKGACPFFGLRHKTFGCLEHKEKQ